MKKNEKHKAIELFKKGTISLGRAAEMAGEPISAFIETLGKLKIPVVNYSFEDVLKELKNFEYEKKNIVVIGLGKTGHSCVRYLKKQGAYVAVIDSRENPPDLEELKQEFPDVLVKCGGFDEALLNQADELIVSPGISIKELAIAAQIAKGKSVIGDIELFARAVKAPVIGITGTNGKSTVTTLVGEMAKAAGLKVGVGGNLGTPALDLLDPTIQLYVLELSSFQLETTISLHLAAATVLNISPDHLDRYANMHEYIAAKQRIFLHCQKAIINRDDPVSYAALKDKNHIISFGLSEPKKAEFGLRKINKDIFLAYGSENLIAANEVLIKGTHQLANALAALALGKAVNFPMTAMLDTLKIFPGLPHRCQWIANKNGVDWYNDSKGTNVYSSLAALEGLGSVIHGKIILLAGGLGKGQDFSPLRSAVQQYAREIILFGQDAPQIAAALKDTAPLVFVKDLAEAVKTAKNSAHSDDAVLLSPACASFDMFKNFEHRGEMFISYVKENL